MAAYVLDPVPAEGPRPSLALLGWDHRYGGWRRLVGLDIPRHGQPAWPVLLAEHRCVQDAQTVYTLPADHVPEVEQLHLRHGGPRSLDDPQLGAALMVLFTLAPPGHCRTCWTLLKGETKEALKRGMCKRCYNIGRPIFDPRTGVRLVWFCQMSKQHRLRRTMLKLVDQNGNERWACPSCYRRITTAMRKG